MSWILEKKNLNRINNSANTSHSLKCILTTTIPSESWFSNSMRTFHAPAPSLLQHLSLFNPFERNINGAFLFLVYFFQFLHGTFIMLSYGHRIYLDPLMNQHVTVDWKQWIDKLLQWNFYSSTVCNSDEVMIK